MKSQILGLRVAGVVFALVCLAQLGRLWIQPQILVCGYEMPLWPSIIAVIISGGLCFWMWKLAATLTKR